MMIAWRVLENIADVFPTSLTDPVTQRAFAGRMHECARAGISGDGGILLFF